MLDRWKLVLGSLVLAGLIVLAVAVAMGKVEEKTSYGLVPILSLLGKVVLDFSEWAFRVRTEEKPPTPEDPKA